ncbi:MAG: DNA repair protein RecN [Rhodobacteraceae bacterium]|nr:DNA repair protein RecN [Paracoccaceae bacterium]
MLRQLEIRDMLLIGRLSLDFREGLNVLTGETGAGKSILLDCLGFVLGWRGRAEVVRAGAAEGEVTAAFDLPEGHAARTVLAEAGLPAGGELILRRTATPDGRRAAWVNDRRASAEVLRALSETLVELHGQHDDRGLLDPRGHRRLLDAFAGAEAALAEVRAAWAARRAAAEALAEAEAALAAARAEEDFLRHAAGELDALAPQPGEEAALDARRRLMQAARRIGEDIARAHAAIGPEGAEGRLIDAVRWLEGAAGPAGGRLDAPLAALGRALAELADADRGIADCLEALDFDEGELERTEERLFAIRALARKHGVAPDALPALAAEIRGRLEALDGGGRDLAARRAALAAAEAGYDAAAARLTALRRAAAGRLDAAMAAELGPLKLERAAFATEVAAAEPGPEGRDAVAFTVATNPGAPPGPIARIASGGELSRFLLALKVCLSRGSEATVLIFDEIDRGVGGATADAVGRRLARLAEGAQVLVVTHSPQVAARAAHHWRVEKVLEDGAARSRVVPLGPAERVDEIARMLAADRVTEEARAAARALLAG